MNWLGICVLGVSVAILGRWLHPFASARRAPFWLLSLAGVLAAVAAKMGGSLSGGFYDGETLEWPACTAAALLAVTLTAVLARR
jgi:hypothetical protein